MPKNEHQEKSKKQSKIKSSSPIVKKNIEPKKFQAYKKNAKEAEIHFDLPDCLKPNRKKIHTKAQEAYYAKKSEACKQLKYEIDNHKPLMGRPSIFTEELAEYILDKIASSPKSVRALCAEDERMPDQTSINHWCWKHPNFFLRYQLAKQQQAHWMADDCEEIAKEIDYITDQQGTQRVDPGFIASRRLMVDTKRWHASKLAPTVFGDRKAVEALQGENETIKAELMALKMQLERANKKEY